MYLLSASGQNTESSLNETDGVGNEHYCVCDLFTQQLIQYSENAAAATFCARIYSRGSVYVKTFHSQTDKSLVFYQEPSSQYLYVCVGV